MKALRKLQSVQSEQYLTVTVFSDPFRTLKSAMFTEDHKGDDCRKRH
jgi:hypothetical protein